MNNLKFFNKMYETMRVVDPLSKKVLEYSENGIMDTAFTCYDFWKRQEACENCISMRAFNEKEAFVKIEYKKDCIYMVTAVPVLLEEKWVVMELLKNITNSLYIENKDEADGLEIYNLIKGFNNNALKDSLTSVYNRRYINERLPVDILNASVRRYPISLVFVDIDYFKNVNDIYGHLAGDLVLKEFVKELSLNIRKGEDWIGRYGGEEFLICLPNTEYKTAHEIGERMRVSIEKMTIHNEDKFIKITASFGIYTLDDKSVYQDMEAAIREVDRKLYQAKNEGRNRVV